MEQSLVRYALKPLMIAALAGTVLVAVLSALSGQRDISALALQYATLQHVNDSTVAVLAHARAQIGALETAATQMHGTAVAGLVVHVDARDTVIRHDTLVTVVHPDTTRTAHFRDSTFAGTLTGDVIAPPHGPLGLSYTLHRPAFHPTIGFINVGGSAVAVVSWQGEQATIEQPFFTPPVAEKRVHEWVGGSVTSGMAYVAGAGLTARVWRGFEVTAEAAVPVLPAATPVLKFGVRTVW